MICEECENEIEEHKAYVVFPTYFEQQDEWIDIYYCIPCLKKIRTKHEKDIIMKKIITELWKADVKK